MGLVVTLLGTGDTTGTPTPGCSCETCQKAIEAGIERTRFSVHVRNTETDECLLVDFSPDFRQQFLAQDVALPDAGIVTHIHFDHLHGLGNAYRLFGYSGTGQSATPILAADEPDPQTGDSVAETVERRYEYLDPIDVRPVSPLETVRVCGLDVTLVPVDHPPLLCYGLAIEDPDSGAKLSLSGDTTYEIPDESRAVLAEPDLLLADGIVPAALCEQHPLGGANYDADGTPRTFGTKHMTREGACALADDLDATTLRIVHAAHFYPADEAFEEPLAVDGEQYELS